MAMTLTSAAFANNDTIPSQYTCDGKDISPPLAWSGAPAGTKSFALIHDDPDAPPGTWVHWIIFNIPSDSTSLPENLPKTAGLPSGARQGQVWGVDSFSRVGYWGPCPPSGTNRYFFKLYALDLLLDLPAKSTKPQLEAAMKGHILAESQLIGLYFRGK